MSQESVESDTSSQGTPRDRPLGSPPQRREALLRLASEKGLLTTNPTPKERAAKELSKRGHTYKSSSIGGIKKKKSRRGKKTGGAIEKEIPSDLQAKIAAVDPKNSQHLWLKPGIIECLLKRGITHAKTEYQEKLFVTLNGVKKGVFISFTKTPGPGVPGSVVSGSPDAVNEVFTQLKRCVQNPDIMTGFAPILPQGVAKNIAEYVPPGGKKRTRKGKKSRKTTRRVKRSS